MQTKTLPAGLFALAFTSFAAAQTVSVNFDNATDLDAFSQRTSGAVGVNGAPSSTALSIGPTAGVVGSGGVVRSAAGAEVTAVYQPAVFDLTANTPFTFSMYFQTGTIAAATSGNTLQLGFLGANNLAFNGDAGNSFITIRITDVNTTDSNFQLQTQTKTTAATSPVTGSLGSAFTLLNNEWYRLSGTLARTATADTFSFTATLEDWGTTGGSLVGSVAGPFTGTFTNATLYSDTSLFAAFRHASASAVASDQFVVVPEPGAFVTVFAGVGLLGLARRRA